MEQTSLQPPHVSKLSHAAPCLHESVSEIFLDPVKEETTSKQTSFHFLKENRTNLRTFLFFMRNIVPLFFQVIIFIVAMTGLIIACLPSQISSLGLCAQIIVTSLILLVVVFFMSLIDSYRCDAEKRISSFENLFAEEDMVDEEKGSGTGGLQDDSTSSDISDGRLDCSEAGMGPRSSVPNSFNEELEGGKDMNIEETFEGIVRLLRLLLLLTPVMVVLVGFFLSLCGWESNGFVVMEFGCVVGICTPLSWIYMSRRIENEIEVMNSHCEQECGNR